MKRMLNTTINRSKNEKNDEHYTQLADIENEVRHCRDQFRGAMRIIKAQGLKGNSSRNKPAQLVGGGRWEGDIHVKCD